MSFFRFSYLTVLLLCLLSATPAIAQKTSPLLETQGDWQCEISEAHILCHSLQSPALALTLPSSGVLRVSFGPVTAPAGGVLRGVQGYRLAFPPSDSAGLLSVDLKGEAQIRPFLHVLTAGQTASFFLGKQHGLPIALKGSSAAVEAMWAFVNAHHIPMPPPFQTGLPAPSAAVSYMPIPLQNGVNTVPDFTPDGGPALIVKAWQNYATGQGIQYIVMNPDGSTINPEGANAPNYGQSFRATNNGEATVLFAHQKAGGGRPQLVVLTAIREWEKANAGQFGLAPVSITLYRMAKETDEGDTNANPAGDYFQQIQHVNVGNYCRADVALATFMGNPPMPEEHIDVRGCER